MKTRWDLILPVLGILATGMAAWDGGPWAAALVSGLFLGLVDRRNRWLRQAIDDQARLARTDDLTGLANDRSFREHLAERGSGLILLDLDDFKSFNDSFGHPAGDEALKQLGVILERRATAYRLGGDEFAVILEAPQSRTGPELAEAIRSAIRDHPWPVRPLRASFGVATIDPTGNPTNLRNWADQALYRAKRAGGDQVCVAEVEPA